MLDDRLADAVNSEPMVYMDCTGNEIVVATILSMTVGLFIGVIIGIAIGKLMIGIILGLLLFLGLLFLALNWIASIRQKYYETWLSEKFFMAKEASGFFGLSLLKTSDRFDRGARN